LNQAAPGQNLNRVVPSKGKVVVSYDFKKTKHGHVTDKSGNHFEGSAKNVKFSDSGATFEGSSKSYITTPIGSMGPPYTLSFTVNPSCFQVLIQYYWPMILHGMLQDSFIR